MIDRRSPVYVAVFAVVAAVLAALLLALVWRWSNARYDRWRAANYEEWVHGPFIPEGFEQVCDTIPPAESEGGAV